MSTDREASTPPDEYDPIIAAIDDAPLEYHVVHAIALGLVAECRRLRKKEALADLAAEFSTFAPCPIGWEEAMQKALETYRGQ